MTLLHMIIDKIERLNGAPELGVDGYDVRIACFNLRKRWDRRLSPSVTVHTIWFDDTLLWSKRGAVKGSGCSTVRGRSISSASS